MKTRETKANDLAALTASLANSTSAMVVSFKGLTVTKDQEFRNSIREAGAKYEVVKNTLARIAVKGTDFEQASDHFKGVTAIAWTENDPVVLSKAISKFMKDNADVYSFKTGVVDGKLVDLTQLTTIANLPSKEELISKLLWVINAQAQRLVTVINAVPRDLAVVIKQIGEAKPADGSASVAEAKAEEPVAEAHAEAPTAEPETAPAEEAAAAETTEAESEATAAAPDDAAEGPTEAAPAEESRAAETSEAESEATAAAPDDAAEDILEIPAEEKSE